eukprot:scaffold267117_cov26-Tisochrysis_lutea.AAC.1
MKIKVSTQHPQGLGDIRWHGGYNLNIGKSAAVILVYLGGQQQPYKVAQSRHLCHGTGTTASCGGASVNGHRDMVPFSN